jgi:hypothetical protein
MVPTVSCADATLHLSPRAAGRCGWFCDATGASSGTSSTTRTWRRERSSCTWTDGAIEDRPGPACTSSRARRSSDRPSGGTPRALNRPAGAGGGGCGPGGAGSVARVDRSPRTRRRCRSPWRSRPPSRWRTAPGGRRARAHRAPRPGRACRSCGSGRSAAPRRCRPA